MVVNTAEQAPLYIRPGQNQHHFLKNHQAHCQLLRDGIQFAASHGGIAGVVTGITNVAADPDVREHLERFVTGQAQDILSTFPARLKNGDAPLSASDLLDYNTVIRSLNDGLPIAEEKPVGRFRTRFLPGRGDKPAGTTAKPRRHNYEPFNKTQFFFDVSCPTCCFYKEILGQPTGLFLQKFPFSQGHLLVCSEPEKYLPQYMTPDLFEWAWTLAKTMLLPGFKMGWNSLAASGSVNHAHLQIINEGDTPLPVEAKSWTFNGGKMEWPGQAVAFAMDECGKALTLLEHLNRMDMTYNLLFTQDRVYFFLRQKVGAFSKGEWTGGGFAFAEMSGLVILTRRSDYDALTKELLNEEFSKMRV